MYNRIVYLLAITAFCCLAAGTLRSQEIHDSAPIQTGLVTEFSTAAPGDTLWALVHFQLEKDWHAYWKNPGDAGMPPSIDWNLPEGFTLKQMLWPTPKKFTSNAMTTFGYQDEILFLAELGIPEDASGTYTISTDLQWVICNEHSCLPGSGTVAANIVVDSEKKAPTAPDLFFKARANIPQSIPLATAKKTGPLIALDIELDSAVHAVEFFPEEPNAIDHSADPQLSPNDSGQNRSYRIVLKEGSLEEPIHSLKGVMVLKSATDDSAYAISIDVPLLPGTAAEIALVSESPRFLAEPYGAQPTENSSSIPFALLLAFAGGLLLNLMPCVLPVISFKILSFVKMAGQSRLLTFQHGIAYSLGVLLSFWILAGALLSLQAYGHSVGWGFQLQHPLFVSLLASIILLFGLSLFGVFEIGTGLASLAGQAQESGKSTGVSSSFFSGILATAIATPCTGPFLGTAVGFAVTLPPLSAMLIFTSLALGLAFPYLLLGAFPGLLQFVPKPGKWMVTFKEITGFIMLGTVIWLLWVFAAQTDSTAVILLLAGFFLLSIGSWIFGKWSAPVCKKRTRIAGFCFALVFLGLGGVLIWEASLPSSDFQDTSIALANPQERAGKWIDFSPDKVAEYQQAGIPVFIDFTAKWCLICQANHLVLSTETVDKKFEELGVIRMKADWTRSNPIITEELKKFGRNSVPLYLLYGKSSGEPAAILPQVLTPEIVLEYLNKL